MRDQECDARVTHGLLYMFVGVRAACMLAFATATVQLVDVMGTCW
jgi:hypothetical protein